MPHSVWDWLSIVRSGLPTNLSNQVATLGRRLTLGGFCVSFSAFDRAAMVIGEHAASGPSLVLFPPDPYAPTCVYVELAAHMAKMSVNVGNKADLLVAVVSSNTGLRTFHRRVRLGAHGNLEVLVPTEVVVGANGAVDRYGDSEVPGATIFVSRPDELQGIADVQLVVVDAPCPDMERAMNYAKHAIYVVRDPSDRAVAKLAATLPTFGWSARDIPAQPQRMLHVGPALHPLAARLDVLARGRQITVESVPAETVARSAAEIWKMLPDLMKGIPRTSAGRDLLKLAFGRYFLLLHQVVPTAQFRRYYGTGLLNGLESAARMVRGEGGSFYLPYFVEGLRELVAVMGDTPPKAEVFERVVRGLIFEDGITNVRVAAPDISAATMTVEYLATLGVTLEVVAFAALPRLEPTRHLVLTGMPPAWARSILGAGVASNLHVLAYADEANSYGTEAHLIGRTLGAAQANAEWLARPEAREICWSMLAAEETDVVDPTPAPPLITNVEAEAQVESEVAPLWSGLLDLGTLTRENGSPGALGLPDASSADAFLVAFSDRRWLLLAADAWVTRLKLGRAEEGVPVPKLIVGDTLVVVDEDPRKDLLDKVIEQAGSVPEYAALGEFVRVWRNAMRRGYLEHGTYGELHRVLAEHGVDVGEAAVGTWVRGSVIGPNDRENVRRVGEALGNENLLRNHGLVCNAITTLRGVHVKLGRRVGDLATREGVAGAVGIRGVDEIVDDVSGLTVGDLRSCVQFLKIAEISHFGTVPAQMLGMLRSPDELLERKR